MGKSQHTITINADIQATLKDMDKVVSELNRGLRDGATKIDLTKGVGNSISKQIDTFKTEYQKFANLTKNNQIDFVDAKEAIKSGEQVIKTFSELRRIVGNFEDLTIFDAKKMFPDAFDSRVGELHKKLTSLGNSITELNNKKIELDDAKNAVSQLEEKSNKLQASLEEKASIKIDTTSAQQELDEANDKIEQLRKDLKDQLHLKLTIAEQTKDKGRARIGEIQAARKSRGATKAPESLTSLKQRGASADEIAAGRKAIELYKEEQKEINAIEEELKKVERAANGYRAALADSDTKKLTDLAKAGEASADKIKEINEALEGQKIATDNLKIANEKLVKHQEEVGNIEKELADTNKELESQRAKVERLDKAYKALQSKVSPENLTKALQEILPNFDKDLLNSEKGIKQLQEQLDKIDEQNYSKLIKSLQDMGLTADSAEDYIKLLRQSLYEVADGAKEIKQAEDEIENLKNQVLQFFSITNSIQLFKRVVSDAINTIKELDAVMTETAVVTDFTVGDMWEKLPIYSKQATGLGASISELYSATTLYYQQGLKTNEAMGVGVETMKMARIANMDATDATTAMTAALRGFNMEVNEMNAQRVNDVYSELAAITAADTNQIATAMGKTASIAASANMEFETTAALLAQIIETTQEAPETAGTAMKTIIARFTEVKELFSEGMLTGKDEEGEEIDINKIDKALKSVGISLKDFLTGSKGIDDIFLELASKWDGLDLATQRYIATMAAGSRQQSRFIAMMSNYDRTMELVNAANNSAGASQNQFNKTLESLEAKLQRLKNAWDEFTMGLANDEIIKFGADLLTSILEGVNGLIKAISGNNGLTKSFVSLATVIGSLKGGGALFNNLFKGSAKKDGKKVFDEFKAGFFGEEVKIEPKIDKKAFLDEVQKLNEDFSDSNISVVGLTFDEKGAQAAIQKVQELEGSVENLDKTLQTSEGSTKSYALNLSKVGAAAVGVGSAISLLSNLAKEQDLDSLATSLEFIGNSFVVAGTAATVLGPIFDVLKIKVVGTASAFALAGEVGAAAGAAITIGWGALIGIFASVAAVIGLIVFAFEAVRKASPEYKLEQTAKAAEDAAEAATKTAEAYDNLKASLDQLEDQKSSLEGLTIGTREWKEAVAELNNEILDLIDKYPELAKYVTSQDGGILGFSEGSEEEIEKIIDSYYQKTVSAQAAEIGAKIVEQKAQQDLYYSQLQDSAKVRNTETVKIDTKDAINSYRQNDPYLSGQTYKGQGDPSEVIQMEVEILTTENREKTIELAKQIASGNWENNDQIQKIKNEDYNRFNQLKSFGQQLLASEKIVNTFTSSLTNSAIINAEVSEDFKKKVGSIYDAEAINKMIARQAESINPFDVQTRQEYATSMGYDYDLESGEFYSGKGEDRKKVAVSYEEIMAQLPVIRVQKSLIKNMELLEDKINLLNDSASKLGEGFLRLASQTEEPKLTMQDLGFLEQLPQFEDGSFGWTESLEYLYKEIGYLYGDRADFMRILNNSYKQAEDIKAQNSNKMNNMGINTSVYDNSNVSVAALSKLLDNLYSSYLTTGSETTSELNDIIANIIQGLDAEQAETFVNALNSIDWTDKTVIENLGEELKQFGFEGTITAEELDKLKETLIKANRAVQSFSLEKIREELEQTEELIDDIGSRDRNERTFTKEQKDLLLKANPNLENRFVITGIDEFTYVGNSIEDLVIALNENTTAQLKEYGNQINDAAKTSELWLDEKNKEAVNTVLEAKDQNKITDIDQVISAMSTLGMDSGRPDLSDFSPQDLIAIIQQEFEKYYGVGGSTAISNIETAEQWKGQEAQLAYQAGTRTDYELLQDAQSEEEYAKYAKNQILAEAAAYSELSDEIKQYNKLLDANGEFKEEVTEKDKKAILQQIKFKTELAKAKEELKKYGEASSDLIAELENLDKNSEDYKDVLNDLSTETSDYLNIDINGAFFEQGENLELLYRALSGDVDAWEQFVINAMIATAASEDMAAQLSSDGEKIATITSALDNLEFDINGTADVSQIMEALLEAGKTVEEVAAYLEELGFTNIDIVADLDLSKMQEAVANGKDIDVDLGSIKATNVRLARSSFNSFSGGGSRSSSSKESQPDPWENPFDKLYNLVREIDEELRQRERIERRYEKLLENLGVSAKKILDISQEELAHLDQERATQEQLIAGRKQQISEYQAENSDLNKYASVTQNERGEDILRIDWDLINSVTDAEEGQRIEDYINQLEEWFDSLEEAEDALQNIEDTVEEIKERGKDEYLELEGAIKDALVQSYQDEIDKLSEINNAINDTNASLLDAIQSSIDKQRQDRDNTRTEEELAEKQRRLLYLQQDTSGANDLEILKLQEEIAKGQEDYTDTLIDQKVSELQEQNDEAAKQRQQQIDIAQAQLDHYIESGGIWQEVYGLMDEGLDKENGLIRGSRLEQILQDAENFQGLSAIGQQEWWRDITKMIAQAISYLELGRQLENLGVAEGTQIEFITEDGQTLTGTVDDKGNVHGSDGNVYGNVYQGSDGKYYAGENAKEPELPETEPSTPEPPETPEESKWTEDNVIGIAEAIWMHGDVAGWGNGYTRWDRIDEKLGRGASDEVQSRINKIVGKKIGVGYAKKDLSAYYYGRFAQGGLADFTGPAWLDGSKARPEIVLDAQDSRNFIQLRDILSSLLNHSVTNTATENNGDITYDIDINVESIGSDYDVDQVANKVKSLINEDARYRNNNAVSLKR